MENKGQLLIKHAVGGRTFVDSLKQPVEYRIEPVGEGWRFTVQLPDVDVIPEILRLKLELNVFVFENTTEGRTKKTWYYVNGGEVAYDESAQKLTLYAGSRIEYFPEEYSYF